MRSRPSGIPLAVVCVAGCRPATPDPVAAPEPGPGPVVRTPELEPATAPRETPRDPPPRHCAVEVRSFDRFDRTTLLSEAISQASHLAVVELSLDEADCSSIGWIHLAVKPRRTLGGDAFELAYRRVDMGVGTPESASGLYLAAVTLEKASTVDLKSVCVGFRATSDARIEWLVPVESDDQAESWVAAVRAGACGKGG